VSDNGGLFMPWMSNTVDTQAVYTGTAGHVYSFYSIARDLVGNIEPTKTAGEASTTVAGAVPGDVNGDGRIGCEDIAIIKAAFGTKAGQAGFDSRADVNNDGIVDVRDLAFVSQYLPAGTQCP
jgi:Dockerin type I domain